MARSAFARWIKSLFGTTDRTAPKRRSRRPLDLEKLEDRLTPTVRIWDGHVDALVTPTGNQSWALGANWQGDIAPAAGDDLLFPSGALMLTNNNTFAAGTQFNSITISGDGYRMVGNRIVLGDANLTGSGGILTNGAALNNQIDFDITLGGNAARRQFITTSPGGSNLTLAGRLSDQAGNPAISLSKDGFGRLILTRDNSGFTGTVTVEQGVLNIRDANALGSYETNPALDVLDRAQITIVEAGAQLQVQNVTAAIHEHLILNGFGTANDGAVLNVSGNTTYTGLIDLDSDSAIGANAGSTITFFGVIADLGSGHNLNKEGAGEAIFSTDNTYRGITSINLGTLTITSAKALGEAGSSFDGTIVRSGIFGAASLRLAGPAAGFTVLDEKLVLNGIGSTSEGSLYNFSGNNTWTGDVTLGSPIPLGSNVYIGVNTGLNLTISGHIDSSLTGVFATPYDLLKIGGGRLILTQANTYAGNTQILYGTVNIRDSNALGGDFSGTIVWSGACLEMEVDDQIDSINFNDPDPWKQLSLSPTEPLTLNGPGFGINPTTGNPYGALYNISGRNIWNNTLDLGFGGAYIGVAPDDLSNPNSTYSTPVNQLAHFQDITSALNEDLTKVGLGELVLSGNKSYLGDTIIQEGYVTIDSNNSLGGQLSFLTPNLQPGTTVLSGAALHLKPAAGQNLTVPENLILSGRGVNNTTYSFLDQQGAVVNLIGCNTLSGSIQLDGQVGVGVQLLPPGLRGPSELTTNGTIADASSGGLVSRTASGGGVAEDRFYLDTGRTGGTFNVSWNFLSVPDRMTVYYGSTLLFDTGVVSGSGTTAITYGPGATTIVQIVINEGNLGSSGTAWNYNVTLPLTTAGGGIDKLGPHRLIIQGDGTYTGNVDIIAGVVRIQNDTALGYPDASAGGTRGTFIRQGTALEMFDQLAKYNGGKIVGNDISYESLHIQSQGYSGATSNGTLIPVGSTIMPFSISAHDNVWRGPIIFDVLDDGIPGSVANGPLPAGNFTYPIEVLGNARLQLLGDITDNVSDPDISAAGFRKLGTGELILSGQNSNYRGVTDIQEGIVTVQSSRALGSSAGATVVSANATLNLQGALTIAGENLFIQGTGAPTNMTHDNAWFNQGPAPTVGGITPGNLTTAGRINSIAVDPFDNNVIYVGAAGGGIWRTRDGGNIWYPLMDTIPALAAQYPQYQSLVVSSIALAPSDSHTIYVGTGEDHSASDSYYGRGVFKSSDDGLTWTLLVDPLWVTANNPLGNPLDRAAITKIVVDPANRDLIYVAASDQGTNGFAGGNAGVWRFDLLGASANGTTPGTWTNMSANSTVDSATHNLYPGGKEIQTVSITANSGLNGNFTLNYLGVSTGLLPIGASAATVAAALSNITTIGTNNIAVTGGIGLGVGGTFTLTFQNALANFNATQITPGNGGLTGVGIVLNFNTTVQGIPRNAGPAPANITFGNDGKFTDISLSNGRLFMAYSGDPGLFAAGRDVGIIEAGVYWTSNLTAANGPLTSWQPNVNQTVPNITTTVTDLNVGNITLPPTVLPAGGNATQMRFPLGAGTNIRLTSVGNTTWASISTPNGTAMVQTTNNGNSWIVLPAPPNYASPNFTLGQGNYSSTLNAVSATNLYAGGDGAVMLSPSGGSTTASWANLSILGGVGPHVVAHAIAARTTNLVLYGTDGGLFQYNRTANSWTSLNGNLETSLVRSVAPHPIDYNVNYLGVQGDGTQVSNGSSPIANATMPTTILDTGDGGTVAVDPNNTNIVYHLKRVFTTGTITLERSLASGASGTWSTVLSGVASLTTPIYIDPINTARLLIATTGGLSESLNQGTSWTALPTTGAGNIVAIATAGYQGLYATDSSFPISIAPDKGAGTYDPDTFYYATSTQVAVTKTHAAGDVLGSTFGRIGIPQNPAGVAMTDISDLAVDPINRDYVYVTNRGFGQPKVLLSTNAGQNWTASIDLTFNLGATNLDVPVNAIVVDRRNTINPLDAPDLYVATDLGVYKLNRATSTWERFGQGMPYVRVLDLTLNPTLNTLSAATYGRGMYTLRMDRENQSPGALSIISGSTVWTGNVTLQTDTTIAAEGTQTVQDGKSAATLTILGSLSGNANITKEGQGRVVFAGNNTFTGNVSVENGVLAVRSQSALGAITNTTEVKANAVLEIQANLTTSNIVVSGNGFAVGDRYTGVIRNTTSVNTLNGNILLKQGGDRAINPYDLSINNGTVSIPPAIPPFDPARTNRITFGVDSGSQLTINGTIADAAGGSNPNLVKELTGKLVFNQDNTYSNQTFINAGILNIRSSQALGGTTAGTTVSDGAQLQVQGNVTFAAEPLKLSGTGIVSTGALLNVAGNNTWTGPVELTSVQSFSPASNPVYASNTNYLALIGIGVTAASDTLRIDSVVRDTPATGLDRSQSAFNIIAFGFDKTGLGNLVLSQNNTFNGDSFVSAGRVVAEHVHALGAFNVNSSLSQYATSVLGFSSQYPTAPNWQAYQALGAPNTFAYGDFGTAWSPQPLNGSIEFITLGYSTPVNATSVTIRETYGNGFVTRVDLIDTNNISHTIFTGPDTSANGVPFNFVINFPVTPYLVKAVHIVLDTNHNLGAWEEIDSVLLVGQLSTTGSTTVKPGANLTLSDPLGVGFNFVGETMNLIGSNANVAVPGGAVYAASGNHSWSGNVNLLLPAGNSTTISYNTLLGVAPNMTFTLPQPVTGAARNANLLKVGNGTVVFQSNNNTINGLVVATAGVTQVDGTIGNVTLNGGTLGGDGAVGRITTNAVGGTVNPGNATAVGSLNSSNVTWNSNATYFVNLLSGVSVDQLAVTGNISLANATLAGLSVPAVPIGSNITIIQATGSVNGTFSNANNTLITADGSLFSINYTPSTVYITRLKPTVPPVLAAIPNPQELGLSAIFNVTIPNTANTTPTGNITYTIDGVPQLGIFPLTSGTTNITLPSNITLGNHTLTAFYSGDGLYNNSSSNLTLTMTPMPVTMGGTATPSSPSNNSAPLTISGNVTGVRPGFGLPNGTLQISEGNTTLGNTTVSSGIYTFTLPAFSLNAGVHTFTITYSGAGNFTAGSTTVVHTLMATPGINLVVNGTLTFGNNQTITATVAPSGNLTPTGNITFLVDGTPVGGGNITLNGSGQANVTTPMTGGNHTITAVYNGDVFFNANTGLTSQTIATATSNSTITLVTPAGPQNPGTPITFTAQVSPNLLATLPTGNVTFFDGNVSLGTGTLTNNNGTATATVTTSAMVFSGTRFVTANYAGDSNYAASTSAPISYVINLLPSTTSISTSNANSFFGQSVVTATVTGAGVTPGGIVTFTANNGTFTQNATLVGGNATFTPPLDAGVYTNLTAQYLGDTNYQPSNATTSINQTVSPALTLTGLSSSTAGANTTYNATVTNSSSGITPVGNVTFTINGSNTTVATTGGIASITLPTPAPGTPFTIIANYLGTANFATSSAPIGISTTTIATANANSYFGQSVVTVTVTGAGPAPTGVVTFTANNGTFSQNVTLVSGNASLSPLVNAGTYSGLTAHYNGDLNYLPSDSLSFNQTINPALTNTTLVANNPSGLGGTTFTATVVNNSSNITPTGNVTFSVNGVNTTVALSGGVANFAPPLTPSGSPYLVQATYVALPNIGGSTSAPINQPIVAAATTTTITTVPSSGIYGQNITLRAQVTSNLTVAGNVTFFLDGVARGNVALSAGSANLTIPLIGAGNHTIRADYLGATFLSTSSGNGTLTMTPANTTLTLTPSANSSFLGQTVSFNATVVNSSGTGVVPTGTVTFLIDGIAQGSPVTLVGGLASFSSSNMTTGNHTVTAQYSAPTNFKAANATVSESVSGTPVVFTSVPANLISGAAFTVQAQVRNSSGAVDATYNGPVTVSINSGPGGTLGGTLTKNAAAGLVSFTGLTLDKAGNYVLSVVSSVLPISALSSTIQVTANRLSAVATAVAVQTDFSITVKALDATNQPASNANGAATVQLVSGPSGATLTGALNATMVNGVVTFSGLRVNVVGTYKFRLSFGGLVVDLTVTSTGRRL